MARHTTALLLVLALVEQSTATHDQSGSVTEDEWWLTPNACVPDWPHEEYCEITNAPAPMTVACCASGPGCDPSTYPNGCGYDGPMSTTVAGKLVVHQHSNNYISYGCMISAATVPGLAGGLPNSVFTTAGFSQVPFIPCSQAVNPAGCRAMGARAYATALAETVTITSAAQYPSVPASEVRPGTYRKVVPCPRTDATWPISLYSQTEFNAFHATASPATARRDPHFTFAHGGKADIRGAHDQVFNLLSHKNVSMNVRFEDADFKWSRRTVHGSKLSAAYWTLKSTTGKTLTVAIEALNKTAAHDKLGRFATVKEGESEAVAITEQTPFVLGEVSVKMVAHKLIVRAGGWEMSAHVAPFPFATLNKGKVLLDVALNPLYDVEKDAVAPHGLVGQSWDGDDVDFDGAKDVAQHDETTTKAQGEGAIEGALADYKMASPFATQFKYSRYGALTAAPRDTTKLSGTKRAKVKTTAAPGGASAPFGMVEQASGYGMQTSASGSW